MLRPVAGISEALAATNDAPAGTAQKRNFDGSMNRGFSVQQLATAKVRNGAFLKQSHKTTDSIGYASIYATVVHVRVAVTKCHKRIRKP